MADDHAGLVGRVRSAAEGWRLPDGEEARSGECEAAFLDEIADAIASINAQRAAAEARAQAAEGAWRPIETAPEDGTYVLLAVTCAGRDPVVGEARFEHTAEGYERDWWWAGNSPGDYAGGPISEINFGRPTHWRPLPAPPIQAEG